MPTPADLTLCGPGVVLHPYVPRDEDELLEAVTESIAEISPFETWCTPRFCSKDAERYIAGWMDAWKSGTGYYFSVRDQTSGRFLGSAGIAGVDRAHLIAGLGYWVRTLETGRGVATSAAGAVARWAIAARGLNRIEVMAAVSNPASRRIAEKIGAEFEGVLRRRLVLPGGPTDMAMYSIIA